MDWKALADQLALGEKQWQVFRDGSEAATMVWNLERSKNTLQAQYDALVTQIDQVQTTIQTAKDETTRLRTQADQDIAKKWADFDVLLATKKAAAQADLDKWTAQIADQTQTFQTQSQWYQTQIAQWEGALAKLQSQVAALEQIKASLKSQLQGVV